jgi:hypothetical protein
MVTKKSAYEAFVVLVAFLILVGASWYVLPIAESLWRADGFVRVSVETVGLLVGGNLDIPVAAAIGVLSGWVLLFLVDGTKRIQAPLLGGAILLTVVPFSARAGRILDTVSRAPLSFTAGVLVALASGAAVARTYEGKSNSSLSWFQSAKWLEFPTTTYVLHASLILYLLITAVDYAISPAPVVDKLLLAISVVCLILVLNVFIGYEYQKRVITLAPHGVGSSGGETIPPSKYDPYLIGGLYGYAKQQHHGFIISGATELSNADDTPECHYSSFSDLQAFTDRVSFGCLNDGLLSRTTIIESDQRSTDSITPDQFSNPSSGSGRSVTRLFNRGLRKLQNVLLLTLPPSLRESPEFSGSLALEMERADVVLLVTPALAQGEDAPDGTEHYAGISKQFGSLVGTDVIIAAIEAQRVANEENYRMDSDVFKRSLCERVGVESKLLDQNYCDIVAVNRFNNDVRRGFDKLLEKVY